MLLFSGTDLKTCLDVVYFILFQLWLVIIYLCTDVVMQKLHIHLFMTEFISLIEFIIEVHMFWPHVIVIPLMHRCYGAGVCYLLIFNSGMECKIPSQRCGRLYFPMFLFNVGMFTPCVHDLLYCSCHIVAFPAYYFKVFHRCCVTSVVLVFIYRWWCLQMFLIPFSKVPDDSPIYSSSQSILSILRLFCYFTIYFILFKTTNHYFVSSS